jgi:hypothetical protein
MPLVVNPITSPPIGLRAVSIATAGYLPAASAFPEWDTRTDRWLTGVTFAPLGCAALVGVAANDPCDYTTTDPVDSFDLPQGEDEETECVDFLPFRAEFNISYRNVSGLPGEIVRDMLEQKRQLYRSYILAREVYNGALVTANSSLVDSATDVSAGVIAGAGARGALGAVEGALGDRIGNGEGFIHIPVSLLELVGGDFTRDGDVYRTRAGHTVIADAGYAGGAPSTGTVTDGRPWIYGSGPVYWDSTGVRDNGEAWQRYDYVHNVANLWSDEHFIAVFDPCTVVAAQVPAAA